MHKINKTNVYTVITIKHYCNVDYVANECWKHRTVLVPLMLHEFVKKWCEQYLGSSKLLIQFMLDVYPKIFHVFSMDGVIIRIHKMLLMNNAMRVYAVVDFLNSIISSLAIWNNMGSKMNILHNHLFQSLCSPIRNLN